MAEPLKLWLISQDANCDYDSYDSAVVVAATERDAREINPSEYVVWSNERWCRRSTGEPLRYDKNRGTDAAWTHPGNVVAKLIGIADGDLQAGQVVCASFNAG